VTINNKQVVLTNSETLTNCPVQNVNVG